MKVNYLGFGGLVQRVPAESDGRQLILSGPQHVDDVFVVVIERSGFPVLAAGRWVTVTTSGTGPRTLLTHPPPE